MLNKNTITPQLISIADQILPLLSNLGNEKEFLLEREEIKIRELMREIENILLEKHIGKKAQELNYGKTKNARHCPNCHSDVPTLLFHQYLETTLRGYSGKIRIKKAYYRCIICEYSECPLEKMLGILPGPWTPHLRDGLALTCALVPHEEGANWLRKVIPGLEVSPKAIEKVGVQEGEKLVIDMEKDANEKWRFFFENDETTIREFLSAMENTPPVDDTVYIQTDGAMVNLREEKWSESRQIIIFWAKERAEINKDRKIILRKHYISKICGVQELRKLLWAGIIREKVWKAKRIVFLGDGAAWIWKMVEELLPNAIQILDFYHVSEKIWEVARAMYPRESPQISIWAKEQEEKLRNGKVKELKETLYEVKKRYRKAQEQVKALLRYMEEHRDRIRYKEFLEQGLDIGSGAVEGANKTIVISRMRRAGMRWNRKSANAVLALRACFLSGNWENRLKEAA